MTYTLDDMNDAAAQELSRLFLAGGWTWEELARAAGLSESGARRYLSGNRDIPVPWLHALATSMGPTAHDVVRIAAESCERDLGRVRQLSGLSPRQIGKAHRDELMQVLEDHDPAAAALGGRKG